MVLLFINSEKAAVEYAFFVPIMRHAFRIERAHVLKHNGANSILFIFFFFVVVSHRVPPPHLSPFVNNEAEGYVPDYAETIKRMQAAAKKQLLPMPGIDDHDLDDAQNLLAEGIIDRTEANEVAEKKRKV